MLIIEQKYIIILGERLYIIKILYSTSKLNYKGVFTMAIVKKEAYFTSSTGVNQIHCCIWQDNETEPKGIFQIAHGVAEHIGRYEDFAVFLAKHGFIVCGNDHLGHGKSAASIDEMGYFAEEDGDIRLVDDMHILSLIMKKRYPGLPLYLFGHSLGSLCARVYAANFGDEINGVILCATGELPSSAVVLEEPLRFLCKKLGTKAKVSNSLFDKISTIGIKDKKTDKDWLSCNAENVQAFLDDPLCGADMKLGAIRDIVSLANSACSTVWALSVPTTLPILIISGAKDPIGFNGKGIIAVSDNLEEAGHEPRVIMYPGDRHEILNEENHENVYYDVLAWLKETLGED